ncbi:hypothetical protein ACWT_4260 [Actinoplanes sp. SE50]|uniref:DUF402 domain-containing protein n=1 Tax=unclassified Actinoplanes TaxID=2626549 RepID=UPI00023EC4AC|nr:MULTISPECIES: DUF402 domain-containing protein [unclassified Actinoplanes]AEV85280.1 hypothetical protein ACPL_4389 [Actinoplanes sp. SE50/110]ATO83675.1 hypothetical protein ACWT_4260 [Actinoplanes sp. SE50]SLM01083.1 hypothetical protein ACSP50_4316 [Actinoplanes sp. SE50/110]
MRFEPGQVIIRRYRRGPWRTWAQPMRVIRDDDAGLLLWAPEGGDFARLVDVDGRTTRDVSPDLMQDPRLARHTWRGNDVLILMPPGAGYSVWWFFVAGGFTGWYINLEKPAVRQEDGVETTDLVLDIVADPARNWEWKDTDEFAELTGHPLYFDSAEAAVIEAEAARLITLLEAGDFPFDGTFTGFRPDPAWDPPRLTDAAMHR